MINVITEMKNEARAEGRAQAANTMVASIGRLVTRGVLIRDAARTEIQDLIDTGALPREIGQAALAQLP